MMRCWSSRAVSCSSSGPASGGSAVADGMVFPPSQEWSRWLISHQPWPHFRPRTKKICRQQSM
jgi:hypothetical protein